MHFEEYGSGPAVLLLHGSPSPTRAFKPLVEALRPRARVLVPHLPGYGQTPRLEPYSIDAVARELEDELIARGVEELAVVGYSMGGYRALQLALSGRIPVRRLVLLGGFADAEPGARAGFREFARLLRAKVLDLEPIAIQRFIAPETAARRPDLAREVGSWATCVSPEVLADEQEALAEMENLLPRIAQLETPIVARVGDLDVATPVAWSEAICRAAPNSVLEIVPGAAHALLVEDTAGTVASVLRALG